MELTICHKTSREGLFWAAAASRKKAAQTAIDNPAASVPAPSLVLVDHLAGEVPIIVGLRSKGLSLSHKTKENAVYTLPGSSGQEGK